MADVLLISRELHSINKAISTGIIEWEKGNRMKNKIAFNILQLANCLQGGI